MGLDTHYFQQANQQHGDAVGGLTTQAVIYSRDQHHGLAEMGKAFVLHTHLLWT